MNQAQLIYQKMGAYSPLWVKKAMPSRVISNTKESSYIPLGYVYMFDPNIQEDTPTLTNKPFGFDFAGKNDKLGVRTGTHITISGVTGSGKTTLLEKILKTSMKRQNDKIGLIISTKEDMELEWQDFQDKCREDGIKTEYLIFGEDNIKLNLEYLPKDGFKMIKKIGLLSLDQERDLTYIHNEYAGRDFLKTFDIVEQQKDAAISERGRAPKWMSVLLSQLNENPYFTRKRSEIFTFERNTLYILDYSKISEPLYRDFAIGATCRQLRNTVVGDPDFQAFVCVDEYFSATMDNPTSSSQGVMDDAFREIRQFATAGRQQGVSIILAYQTRYNVRKIIGPLTQTDYFFQLSPSNMESDGNFFVKNVVNQKIGKYGLMDFFNGLESVIGACVFFETKTRTKPPVFGQITLSDT